MYLKYRITIRYMFILLTAIKNSKNGITFFNNLDNIKQR